VTAAAGLLRLAAEQGVEISRVGDRLRVRPAAAISPALRECLLAAKGELLRMVPEAATQEAVAWRVDAMLAQVPESGPIVGILTARDGAWPDDGEHCISCGDSVPAVALGRGAFGARMRCDACCEAAGQAVAARRQRS
jgi:putative heme iron utilization protein